MFNGGKMHHVFLFNEETKRYDENGKFFSSEAQEALEHGTLYYKIDGSNGMIRVIRPNNIDGSTDENAPFILKAYQRLDTKGKDPSIAKDGAGAAAEVALILLPDGPNASSYADHSYYYSEIMLNVNGRKLVRRNRAMLDLVQQRHADHFIKMEQEWISIEWVGTMFNKTPNVPHPIAIAIHAEQRVEYDATEGHDVNDANDEDYSDARENGKGVPVHGNTGTNENDKPRATMYTSSEPKPIIVRTYQGVRTFLMEDCVDQPIEGLVIEHERTYWKIRCDCFLLPNGNKDPFARNRDKAMPPVFLA